MLNKACSGGSVGLGGKVDLLLPVCDSGYFQPVRGGLDGGVAGIGHVGPVGDPGDPGALEH